jgi:hypothetical protein
MVELTQSNYKKMSANYAFLSVLLEINYAFLSYEYAFYYALHINSAYICSITFPLLTNWNSKNPLITSSHCGNRTSSLRRVTS